MNNKHSEYNIRPGAFAVFIGIIFIIAGFFFIAVLIGFNPEDSLYFTTQLNSEVEHFLGKPGAGISSFLFYYTGRGAFVFIYFLIYSGFVFFKRITPGKKAGYLLLCIIALASSMVFFSRLFGDDLQKGGGLLGNIFLERLSTKNNQNLPVIIISSVFIGITLLTLIFPVKKIVHMIIGDRSPVRGYRDTKPQNIIQGEEISGEAHEDALFVEKDKIFNKKNREKLKIHRKKPPLIKRVFYNDDDPFVYRAHKGFFDKDEEDSFPPETNLDDLTIEDLDRNESPLEGENGQYLLPRSPSGKGRSDPKGLKKKAYPDVSLLAKSKSVNKKEREKETLNKAQELERTLSEFGIEAKVIGIIRGPVITRYELQPAPGVKLSRIVNLSDNIALSLSASGVRIEAPIPGRAAVGIEIPNREREIVTFGDIFEDARVEGELPLILGKEISGKVVVSDLTEMPHLLIAGATGSGKSVCVNSLIVSLLFQKSKDQVRFVMIDPKMVELKIYNGIPHLLTEVITDPREAAKALRWVIYEMENRYRLLDEMFVRDIKTYNQKVKEELPYIVVIIDEFANLMAIAQKEIEDTVVRLAAMSRAVGIHLIMATQRPSVDVITGLIKANFPYRIAFQVASKTDSRTIMDSMGAEKLLGRGDMLFAPAGSMNVRRIQGAYIQEDEVFRLVKDIKKNSSPDYNDEILSFEKTEGRDIDDNDPIFDEAVETVLRTKRASASFLQRRLKIGYNRAARLIELMEDKGIIGPPRGSKPREIYIEGGD
jgi:DNA segregation ATPase FtsK/SpoIIIE-like protein